MNYHNTSDTNIMPSLSSPGISGAGQMLSRFLPSMLPFLGLEVCTHSSYQKLDGYTPYYILGTYV